MKNNSSYSELQVTSNYSFLRGASHPEELASRSKELGYKSIAITDRNTLAGVVRMHAACKKHNIRMIVGARLDFIDSYILSFYRWLVKDIGHHIYGGDPCVLQPDLSFLI